MIECKTPSFFTTEENNFAENENASFWNTINAIQDTKAEGRSIEK